MIKVDLRGIPCETFAGISTGLRSIVARLPPGQINHFIRRGIKHPTVMVSGIGGQTGERLAESIQIPVLSTFYELDSLCRREDRSRHHTSEPEECCWTQQVGVLVRLSTVNLLQII